MSSENERRLPAEMLARHAGELVYVRLEPARIDWFNKIIEGYDNLAMVSTIERESDQNSGLLACWATADTRPLLLKLLSKLHIEVVQAHI